MSKDPLKKMVQDLAFEKSREGLQENLDDLVVGIDRLIVGVSGSVEGVTWDAPKVVLEDLKAATLKAKAKIAALELPA